MGDRLRLGKPPRHVISQSGQLSLAIAPWIGEMSTGDGFSHRQGRNSEFGVTAGTVTMHDCWHTDLVKGDTSI